MFIRDAVVYTVSFEGVELEDDKYVKVISKTIEEAFQKVKEAYPKRIVSHLYAETSSMVFRDEGKPPRWTVLA